MGTLAGALSGGVASGSGQLGRTTVGVSSAGGGSGFVAVSGPYALSAAASTGGLTGHLRGGSSTQSIRALIYTDAGGRPGTFVAASQQVTVAAGAPAAWTAFPLAGPAALPAGTYWLGYWFGGSGVQVTYDTVAGSGRYAPASYSSTGNPPASFAGGTASNLAFSLYATLGGGGGGGGGGVPADQTLPAVSGAAAVGQTLTATTGGWTNSPTGFAYQWQRCDTGGSSCQPITGATGQTYLLVAADTGSTIRVAVTASNANGDSTPAASEPTPVVTSAPPPPDTLGRTTVGAAAAGGGSGYIAVSGPYTLTTASTGTSLTGHLRGGSTAQPIRALIYTDAGGRPGTFVAASQQVTVAAGAPAAWTAFPLASPAALPAGTYWLGYWFGGTGIQVTYDTIAGSGRYTPASYSSTGNPPTSFTGGTPSDLAFSLYATLGGGGGGGGRRTRARRRSARRPCPRGRSAPTPAAGRTARPASATSGRPATTTARTARTTTPPEPNPDLIVPGEGLVSYSSLRVVVTATNAEGSGSATSAVKYIAPTFNESTGGFYEYYPLPRPKGSRTRIPAPGPTRSTGTGRSR